MRRTTTHHLTTFERTGEEAVTYDLSEKNVVTIILPQFSSWSSGPHWHEQHTEFLCVLKGRMKLMLGSTRRTLGPEDGEVEVPRYTVHEWSRDQNAASLEETIVRERTAPADGQKEDFFRVLNSVLLEPAPSRFHGPLVWPLTLFQSWIEEWVVPVQLFIIFRHFDNFPVLVRADSSLLSRYLTHLVLLLACATGQVLGLSATYHEYVSRDPPNTSIMKAQKSA